MDDDKTIILNRKIALDAGLSETEADIVANRLQQNSNAIKRFEDLEADIKRIKTAAKWFGGLLLANYSSNILDWLSR